MRKTKYILLFAAIISLASCGIFKKDCGCPHFGKTRPAKATTSTSLYV